MPKRPVRCMRWFRPLWTFPGEWARRGRRRGWQPVGCAQRLATGGSRSDLRSGALAHRNIRARLERA